MPFIVSTPENNPYHPYAGLNEYMNNLFNVCYLMDSAQVVVMHTQVTATRRELAVQEARNEIGENAYIISVERHHNDLNPQWMEDPAQ